MAAPLIFYATMGFEAACSLSSRIKDARKNAPLAIFISFGLVLCIVMLYQTLFYGALGEYLVNAIDYRDAFPGLLQKLLPNNLALGNKMVGILHLALASSALGGAYGIIFSNTWNVFALAENKHLFASDWFATFNKHAIPVGCVILQGAICITYILVTRGNQVPLQTMSSLGVVIAYTLSVASLFAAKINRPSININLLIPILGLANCALLIFACVRGLIARGITSLSAFSIFLCLGIVMFMSTKKR